MSQEEPPDKAIQKFFWKGKRVTEKAFKKRQQQVELAKKLKSVHGRYASINLKDDDATNLKGDDAKKTDFIVEGRRIINMKHVAHNMFCLSCKAVLSFIDIKEEKRVGVASLFSIQCRVCQKITVVTTDKQHKVDGQLSHFDCNTELVLGNDICIYKYRFFFHKENNREV